MEKEKLMAMASETMNILDDIQVRGAEAHKLMRVKQLVAGFAGALLDSKPEEPTKVPARKPRKPRQAKIDEAAFMRK